MIASRFMDTVGDGSGSTNMAVNGSITPVEFLIKPADGEILHLARMMPFLQDGGSFDSGGYGNGSALTNGIEILVRRNGVTTIDLTAGLTIKTNTNWGRLCYDVDHSSYGSGNETLSARYTFTKESGDGIILDGSNGDEFVVIISDNLTNLVEQSIRVGIDK